MDRQDSPGTGYRLPVLGGFSGADPGPGGIHGTQYDLTEAPRHPCAKCARIQKTCCQRAEIVLTEGDLARIARHTGGPEFWERRTPTDPSYTEPDPDDPNWQRWTVEPDGTRRVLRRLPAGDCTFLGKDGCTLPGDVRPLVCRLYPWRYTEKGIDGIDDGYCPTARVAPPGRTMIQALDMDAAEGLRWHRMLYEELRTRREAL